ncbi:MAG: hypothetical protein IJT88_02590, partial [Kiritimatiellae bacterium]|nr:hypothetical protein [Kiritimatiellia bacterium]
PADTISRLVDAAVKAVEKIGVDTIADKANEAIEKAIAKDDAPAPSDEATPVPAPAASTPALSLNWCWGGFNGSKAKEVSDAQIDSLKITSSGMSYKWVKGGCENLGANSRDDKDHTIACLFLEDGRGGKFDWISTSRTTRDFKNINIGYNGWDADAFRACKTFYFCICSADGKRRTNVISCGPAAAPAPTASKRDPLGCVHATCWNGKNASQRYMNMLSPKMSNDKFNSYLSAIKKRGCDTVHLLLLNKGDGENSGYSIYGTGGTGSINKDVVSFMLARLKIFRNEGFHIVLWGTADDSNDWADAMLANPAKYASDLKTSGILDFADICALGLEMNEYGSASGWKALAKALRKVDPDLYLATHHTSGKYTYASLGSGVMGQLDKDCSTSDIQAQIKKIKSLGKDAWGFEYDRKPNRAKAEAALAKGAKGVGNW